MTTFGAERLKQDLESVGLSIVGPTDSGAHRFVVVQDYNIQVGRFAGTTTDLAVLAPPDFPTTSPSGLYPRALLVPAGTLNVHARAAEVQGLPPGDWLYWSRPVKPGMWNPNNAGKVLLTHWNTVFADARLAHV